MPHSSSAPLQRLQTGADVIDLSADDDSGTRTPRAARWLSSSQLNDEQLARSLQQREYGQEVEDEARNRGRKRQRTQAVHETVHHTDTPHAAESAHAPPVGAFPTSSSSSAVRSPPAVPPSDCAFHVNYIRGVSSEHSVRLRSLVVGDVRRAVALNYCWDLPWLLDECPLLQTVERVDCVAGERYKYAERGREELRQQADALQLPNIHTHFARLPLPYSCHHTKLLLLVYGHGLRFIHTTANFLQCDVSYKNQAVFVQDFPLRQPSQQRPPHSSQSTHSAQPDWDNSAWWLHNDFERSLCEYFAHYAGIGLDLLPLLRQFDYRSARAVLIPSAPGTYTGQQMARYGHMKVRAVLQRELTGTADIASQPIVAQFSSLGSVQSKWLTELRRSLGATSGPLQSSEPPAIRLIWPTLDDVRDSIEGWMAGGSLCCDSRNLNSTVRPLLHHWDGSVSGRHQAAPHIKSYCRANGQDAAYVLVTSANLSAAAWGKLQKNDTQLAIRHYELGLLFTPSVLQRHYRAPAALRTFSCTEPSEQSLPLSDTSTDARVLLWLPDVKARQPSAEQRLSPLLSFVPPVHVVLCPLPYNVCAARYSATDEPWRWDEDQQQPDRRGATFVAVGSRR